MNQCPQCGYDTLDHTLSDGCIVSICKRCCIIFDITYYTAHECGLDSDELFK